MTSGPGEFAVTAGWGVTGFEEGLSPTLRMLQARFLALVALDSQSTCNGVKLGPKW